MLDCDALLEAIFPPCELETLLSNLFVLGDFMSSWQGLTFFLFAVVLLETVSSFVASSLNLSIDRFLEGSRGHDVGNLLRVS